MQGLDLENIEVIEEPFSPFDSLIQDKNKTATPENTEGEETVETPDINPDNIFGDSEDTSENLDNEDVKKTTPFGVFANALVEEGVFTSIKEEDLKEVDNSEKLIELVEKEISSRLTEKQRRIDEALSVDVPVDTVRQYEGVIEFLDTIEDATLSDEGEDGAKLRENLIMQDFLNRGFSKERAARETKKSFDTGSDIEDAKEALLSNKTFYKEKYTLTIKQKQDAINAEKTAEVTKHKNIENKILKDKELLPGVEINEDTRKKIADNLYKPVFTDAKGRKFSAIQKFQEENSEEFMTKLATIFTLTNGFKDFNKIIAPIVNKQTKKAINELEHTIRGGNIPNNSGLQFFNQMSDENSNDTGTFELDIN